MALGTMIAQPPIVLNPKNNAWFVCGYEQAFTKCELKLYSKNSNVEGSTSGSAGSIWEEYGAGPRRWEFSADGVVRSDMMAAAVAPPAASQVTSGTGPLDMIEGSVYLMHFLLRRPLSLGVGDAGFGYWGNGIMEEVPVPAFDPREGAMTWRCAGKGQGPLFGPVTVPLAGNGAITPT